MANPFVHIELHTGDTSRAKEFYNGLFSWKLEDVPMGGLLLHDDSSRGGHRGWHDAKTIPRGAKPMGLVRSSG